MYKFKNIVKTKTSSSKGAFTLVEIMVAAFIGTIILSFIFIFLGDIVDTISKTKKEVRSLSSFYDFSIKLNNYRDIYTTGSIVLDNTGTGSDVFMLKDINSNDGVLFGSVSVEEYRLSTSTTVHKNIVLGYRLLSAQDLINIDADSSVIDDYLFHEDNIFYDLKIQDLQVNMYNGSSIFDVEIVANTNYQDGLSGELWNTLPRDDLLKLNLNF